MSDHNPASYPPPLTIGGLRRHFRETYQLGETQIELMVNSSRMSLEKILSEAEVALEAADSCRELVQVGHNLKGLLLNMGAPQWADVARDLEKSARAGEERDYAVIVARLGQGLAEVLSSGS